ncbi:hypothetical protein EGR_08028 [Echinococcus granulosus]|uniref:Uncharacterized protein n=1 Tax=Echinococcus granulosus TaxID=6210 RepID=W6UUR7_ECHGR|nr:hypothetical protein EGR_08028 [Echinococcus granulosus]EUB57144.1 hypothetical protein EGR_08028 [Echinococcus granulosus]
MVSAMTVAGDYEANGDESFPTLRSKVVVPTVVHRFLPPSPSPFLPSPTSAPLRRGQQQERQKRHRVTEELALAQHHLALYTGFFSQFLHNGGSGDLTNTTQIGRKRSAASLKNCDGRDENVDSKLLRRSPKASSFTERRRVVQNSSPEEGEAFDDDEDYDDQNKNEEDEGGARYSDVNNRMLRQSALLPTPSRSSLNLLTDGLKFGVKGREKIQREVGEVNTRVFLVFSALLLLLPPLGRFLHLILIESFLRFVVVDNRKKLTVLSLAYEVACLLAGWFDPDKSGFFPRISTLSPTLICKLSGK